MLLVSWKEMKGARYALYPKERLRELNVPCVLERDGGSWIWLVLQRDGRSRMFLVSWKDIEGTRYALVHGELKKEPKVADILALGKEREEARCSVSLKERWKEPDVPLSLGVRWREPNVPWMLKGCRRIWIWLRFLFLVSRFMYLWSQVC